MKNLKNNIWMALIYDCVVVASFTWLAISFDKWWIVVFGFFFLMIPTRKVKYYRVCDHCGKHGPVANTYNDAIDKALSLGWIHKPKLRTDDSDNFEDYCPECQKKLRMYK